MTAVQVQERVGKIILHFGYLRADGAGLCHKSIYFCAAEHATLDETKSPTEEIYYCIILTQQRRIFFLDFKKSSGFEKFRQMVQFSQAGKRQNFHDSKAR